MKPRVVAVIVLSLVVIGTIIAYQAVSSSKSHSNQNNPWSTQPDYNYNSGPATPSPQSRSQSTSRDSTAPVTGKEEVNSQGKRRPPQYLHICDAADGTEYVSQGTPKCLGDDQYQSDYSPSVAGTVFSSPCKTNSGTVRYIYISNDETCPAGTTLLFYNSLGGPTSGSSSGSSNQITN